MQNPPNEQMISACLKRYNPSRRPGKFLQAGGTCVVYELEDAAQPEQIHPLEPGYVYPAQPEQIHPQKPEQIHPPEVLKVMYTWCFSPDASDSVFNVSKRQQMYHYFTEEAKIMRELSGCRYTVPLIDSFVCMPDASPFIWEKAQQNGFRVLVFIIMPRLSGLMDYNRKFPLSENGFIRMATDICTALQECHRHNILHRDVKPWNIFVSFHENAMDSGENHSGTPTHSGENHSGNATDSGENHSGNATDSGENHSGNANDSVENVRFLLGDFGLCRRNPFRDGYISRVGTQGFTTPSILAGKAPETGCYNSDLSSLGVSIYYLLTGSPNPEDAPAFTGISEDFRRIIRKASLPNAKERYWDAEEMLQDLRKLSGGTLHEPFRGVIADPDFLEAKQALLHRKYSKAMELAGNGVKKGSTDCQRLLACCMYLEYGAGNPEISGRIARELEMLAYEGDGKARYLRAVIHLKRDEWEPGMEILRCAAEDDNVVSAQYDYGWYLYNGYYGLKKDPEAGLFYLEQAAKAGYRPALYRLKHMLPRPECDPDVLELIQEFADKADGGKQYITELERQAFVDFL